MTGVCPDCGSPLPKDVALMGLCPQCLLSMALEDEESETLHGVASPGGILGERYQIREVLGRGGMGEVFRAFDLKLRVDVALKAVRPELSSSDKARELLRQEVRSAREVVSPNVCRIFDLVVEEGRELVSMEYIDGTTLAETLRERGPLELQEAREVAAQFLSGLEAIHEAGLVHRDFKPENVMLTRAGRVVVMDFGLAKSRTELGGRTIAGTPAYMSPEQSRGESVDARADVFSAGVVLAEMLTSGPRDAIWQAVRESPPRVPEGPWTPVLRQALAADRETRHPTARALARALDEVTHRLPGFEDKHPYPGLASFTQEDAEYFFGREVEIEAVWKKLKRPRLLALIGPSGAGKSSFLKAGLLPTLPPGWRVILSTPGNRPFSALAQSSLPAFAGDMEAIQSFMDFERGTAVPLLSKWRQGAEHALVIVDQFEELFTLNPPEVQEAFATLLGRLVLEADVHVLLSLRDDFLFHCQNHEALSPVFSELTPLGRLSPSALRRALVQPALACGYRFEDEAPVEEMVSEVSRERGVLPLLAFAASRLWEKRDRERGLLTREAYQEIGGVGGALARHAEETLEKIGTERTPLVRELFRNLVTAQGTRASREVQDLLSIFSREDLRQAAEEVLRELVAARLLTSYETSIEIIHESLLSSWPRLVRWQTQDADGAQLRDQLRQAAQAWQDRGRPDGLLWTGKSYRELSLWRESYTGGLSATEEAFSLAATKMAGTRRRRRRLAVAASFTLMLGVMGIFFSLWRRAVLEVSRREAAQILALGRLELEDRPTSALAHALASLERADNEPARRFAVEALWHGGAAIVLERNINDVDFSPDGQWLATGGVQSGVLRLWSRDGGPPKTLGDGSGVAFGPGSEFLASAVGKTVRLWSVPEGKEIRKRELGEEVGGIFRRGEHLLSGSTSGTTRVYRDWTFADREPVIVGSLDDVSDVPFRDIDAGAEWLITGRRNEVYLSPLRDTRSDRARLIGKHEAPLVSIASHPKAPRIVSGDETGEIRIWSYTEESAHLERTLRAPASEASFDPIDSFLIVTRTGSHSSPEIAYLLDLKGPPDAEPLVLRNGNVHWLTSSAFHPEGLWLATADVEFGILWPLQQKYSRVLRGQSPPYIDVAFTPDGKSLISASDDGTVRLWPLSAEGSARSEILLSNGALFGGSLTVDPEGTLALVSDRFGPNAFLVPLQGGDPRRLSEFTEAAGPFAFLEGGSLAAARFGTQGFRVWDRHSGEGQFLEGRIGGENCVGGTNRYDRMVVDLKFLPDGRLLTSGGGGIIAWDIPEGRGDQIRPFRCGWVPMGGKVMDGRLAVDPKRNRFLVADPNPETRVSTFSFYDLETGTSREIPSHGKGVNAVALDSTGTIVVTGSFDGVVRVGPVTGEDPHLLYGHTLDISSVAVSPDGKWIASGSQDGTIRLWPMPVGPPLHTLPYEEILERIRGLTNLRVVPDESTGYRVEIGPFPGWARVPEW